ncbi:MAG: hypothetical protein HOP28_04500, partial [Gemmatimonadales bacterium]|nr:hypothetical protein [Gemmatimonadales bacterium]
MDKGGPAIGAGVTVPPGRPQRVLIIDDAIRWGGSIVSTANLVRVLDRARFDPIFVTATNRKLIERHLREAAPATRIVIARPWLHYERLDRIAERTARLHSPILRTATEMGVALLRHLANLPYTVKLAFLMLRERIDLVQLNSGLGQDEAALAAFVLRIPQIAFLRGYSAMSRSQRYLFAPKIERFVTVSRYIARR